MTDSDLRLQLIQFNKRALQWGIGMACGAAVLWIVSYVIVAFMTLAILFVVFRLDPEAGMVHGITLAVMLILLIDGVRYTGKLFDFERYWDSFYSIGANQVHVVVTDNGVSATRGNPLQVAFGISQLLLCAPRGSLSAWQRFRSRVEIDDARIAVATQLFQELAGTRDWIDVVHFGARAPALSYLAAVELLWTRVHEGRAQVKLAASARSTYLGA